MSAGSIDAFLSLCQGVGFNDLTIMPDDEGQVFPRRKRLESVKKIEFAERRKQQSREPIVATHAWGAHNSTRKHLLPSHLRPLVCASILSFSYVCVGVEMDLSGLSCC
jgi:hypothetical protein